MRHLPAVSSQQTRLLTAKPSDPLTDDLLEEKQRVHNFLFQQDKESGSTAKQILPVPLEVDADADESDV